MEIILLKDLDNLGYKHDVVTVKPGYGRNYIIPQGLGVIANAVNKAKLGDIIAKEEAKEAAKVDEYKVLAEKINGQTLKIGVKAGTSGKIFGSVTNVQIAAALNEQFGVEVERRKVELEGEAKELGTYPVKVVFYKDVVADVSYELIQE